MEGTLLATLAEGWLEESEPAEEANVLERLALKALSLYICLG